MIKITNLLSAIALITFTLGMTSCGDNENACDNTCPVGQILSIDCECFPENGSDQAGIITVSENITTDVTWTADNTYVLAGRISVINGATLTVEPGTLIKAESGALANAKALLVARGSRIDACGTAVAPIIMTAEADQITPEMISLGNFVSPNLQTDVQGLWGGLIVLGNAPISIEGDGPEAQIEGIPTSDSAGLYGGNDPADNSGNLCYISIRHGGTDIGEGNEINGLTLGGVGSGTNINNIEVVANRDDGVEWFGGTVSCSNILVWNCGDDGLDTDQGYSGTVTDWIVAAPQGGSAMELDGPEGSSLGSCNNFNNGIIFAGDNIDRIIDWDGTTNTGVSDIFITGIAADYDPAIGIESFGGDGLCTTGNWEYTIPAGFDAATLFADVPAGAAVEVTTNTVGPDSGDFSWTLGAASGTLEALGL